MFKTEQLGMQALVEMIEKEFPGAIWGVGRCPCKEHPGAYVATITFVPAEDDAVVYDVELDTAGGCGDESCEVWTEDSEDQLEEEA